MPITDLLPAFNEFFGEGKFRVFEDFKERLIEFQRKTGTSYVINSSCNANNYFKTAKQILPRRVTYKYVNYSCVHGSTKHTGKTERAKYTKCPSRFTLTYNNGVYEFVNLNMRHNHAFEKENPFIYPKNRKLSPDQERIVYQLVQASQTSAAIRQFVSNLFNIELTMSDVRHLRDKLKANPPLEPVSSTLPSAGKVYPNRGQMPHPSPPAKPSDGVVEDKRDKSETNETPSNANQPITEPQMDVDPPSGELPAASCSSASDDPSPSETKAKKLEMARKLTAQLSSALVGLGDTSFELHCRFIQKYTRLLKTEPVVKAHCCASKILPVPPPPKPLEPPSSVPAPSVAPTSVPFTNPVIYDVPDIIFICD
ncbi:unnamed protein product [Calicophoron daubneyi]|uniref:ZSWIM3 N-terminal domain-containing protein n=1 Tax=Calicophoron daubneyi TaxID=300641 RepID=A0AAV2TD82_CALDB